MSWQPHVRFLDTPQDRFTDQPVCHDQSDTRRDQLLAILQDPTSSDDNQEAARGDLWLEFPTS